jgi:hypothetical protein
MKTEVTVAIIAATAAIASALFSALGQVRITRLKAQLERDLSKEEQKGELERIMARFREPLGYAAFDLQSRLYNVLEQNLVSVYIERGDERSRSYVVNNTVFLVGQYFAWTEIIRKEIQFLDLGESTLSSTLARSPRPPVSGAGLTGSYLPQIRGGQGGRGRAALLPGGGRPYGLGPRRNRRRWGAGDPRRPGHSLRAWAVDPSRRHGGGPCGHRDRRGHPPSCPVQGRAPGGRGGQPRGYATLLSLVQHGPDRLPLSGTCGPVCRAP